MSLAENFEKMLAAGKDSALLRFSLGNAYLQAGDHARAASHLDAAVAQDAGYSAAWKLLGKARAALADFRRIAPEFSLAKQKRPDSSNPVAYREWFENVWLPAARKAGLPE